MTCSVKEYKREIHRRSYEKHKERRLAEAREWKARNKERMKAARAAYYAANKEKESAMTKAWKAANPELFKESKRISDMKYRSVSLEKIKAQRSSSRARAQRNAKARVRYHSDPTYNVEMRIRATLTQALRLYGNGQKTESTRDLVGCSIQKLVAHIEQQFKHGMTWTNRNEWHIDHIRPCASFDLSDLEQQRKCFHYGNLQPLWAVDNIRKGAKV